jgi:hypothetical protein
MIEQDQSRKRIGRPIKPVTGRPRHQLGIIVAADLKKRIAARALEHGTSMGQETEHLILQGLAVVDVLNFIRKGMP